MTAEVKSGKAKNEHMFSGLPRKRTNSRRLGMSALCQQSSWKLGGEAESGQDPWSSSVRLSVIACLDRSACDWSPPSLAPYSERGCLLCRRSPGLSRGLRDDRRSQPSTHTRRIANHLPRRRWHFAINRRHRKFKKTPVCALRGSSGRYGAVT